MCSHPTWGPRNPRDSKWEPPCHLLEEDSPSTCCFSNSLQMPGAVCPLSPQHPTTRRPWVCEMMTLCTVRSQPPRPQEEGSWEANGLALRRDWNLFLMAPEPVFI